MTLKSMTGHGAAHAECGSKRVVVDVRTVNHRFFEARMKMPLEDPLLASEVEAMLRTRLVRGRAELIARLEGGATQSGGVDKARLRKVWSEWAELRDELAPSMPLSLELLARAPGAYGSRDDEHDREQIRDATLRAAGLACDALDTMRRTEGAELEKDLRGRLARVGEITESIATTTANAAQTAFARHRDRVTALLASHDIALSPEKLLPELAQLADRADVTEEITRLRSHCAQFASALGGASPEGIGKRLDFLLQELGRETNTAGSKSVLSDATHLVIDLKAELERIREQVQNVL